MIAYNIPSGEAFQQHIESFFSKYPNDALRRVVDAALRELLVRRIPMPGKPGAWAGGIVYAIGSRGCGVPDVFNREIEEAFGTTMNTIRRRAAQVRRALDI